MLPLLTDDRGQYVYVTCIAYRMMTDISSTCVPGYLVSTSQLLPHFIFSAYEVWVLLVLYFTGERTKQRG